MNISLLININPWININKRYNFTVTLLNQFLKVRNSEKQYSYHVTEIINGSLSAYLSFLTQENNTTSSARSSFCPCRSTSRLFSTFCCSWLVGLHKRTPMTSILSLPKERTSNILGGREKLRQKYPFPKGLSFMECHFKVNFVPLAEDHCSSQGNKDLHDFWV